jgi:hypothetical protein
MKDYGIKLGDKVKCKMSGFSGIAQGYTESLNGNIMFHVQPQQPKDSTEFPNAIEVDAASIKVTKKQYLPEPTEPEAYTDIGLGDTVITLSGIKMITYNRKVYWNRCVYFGLEYKDNNCELKTTVCSATELTLVKKAAVKKEVVKTTGGPSTPLRSSK